MKKEEIKFLKRVLEDSNTEINYLYTFYEVASMFDDIEDLKKYLLKEHDLCVDLHNKGVDRLHALLGSPKEN